MKLSSRSRRWLIITGSALLLYAVGGFFVAPPLVRSQIEERASGALHRAVTIAKVRINPFAMSVSVEGLHVADHDGGELASWERAYINFDPVTSLLQWRWHLGEFRLTQPRQRLRIAPDGVLNIADLFPVPTESESAPPAPTPAPLPAVGVGLLRVEGWSVDFTDQSRRTAFHTVAGPMTFELRDFSTAPDNAGPYTFAGSTDTVEQLAWSGTISAAPLSTRGRIEIKNISLARHMPLLEQHFRGEIASGRASLVIHYELGVGETPIARISNSTFTIEDLDLRARQATEPAVIWKKLEMEINQADLIARTADLTRVTLTGLDARAERLADGSIDLLALLPAPSTLPEPDPRTLPDPGPAPSVRIAEVALIDSRIRATDHTTPHPGIIELDQINVTAANVGTDLDREIKLDATTRWGGSGSLAVVGVVRVLPFAAALEVSGDDLDLRPLSPWIEPFANVRIAAGTEHFRGHVDASQARGDPLSLAWKGDSGVDNLDLRDAATDATLLAWDSLTYTDTHFNLAPMEISAGEIALVNPVAHVAVDETGVLNISSILPAAEIDAATPEPTFTGTEYTATTTSATVAAATHQSLPFAAKVDAITISGGKVSVIDRSVPGGFTTELRDFAGSIRGLSSANLARADVELSGSLDGVAPLHVKGTINPLAEDQFSDLRVSFSNIDLPLFTPYASKYLGQKIQKGKLNVDVTYRVSQNILDAENNATLDQFYLGDKVASPDAIKAPIGLVLAILRERDGTIPLHMPIRGSLDDPDFKYGQLVMQFLGGLVAKAATAPFKMLGGMFGGGKDVDLSYVAFASGSAAFSESAEEKLRVLVTALHERPALRLELSSPPSREGDQAGLREQRLQAELLAVRPAPADKVRSPAEIDDLVRILFVHRFPVDVPAVTAPAAPVATGTTADEPKKPGFFQRVTRRVFGGNDNASTTAPTEMAPGAADAAALEAAPPPPTIPEMRARLLESIELTDADFQELASARARAVRDRLVADGTVEAERVFLVTEPTVPEGANNAIDGGRVFFGLE